MVGDLEEMVEKVLARNFKFLEENRANDLGQVLATKFEFLYANRASMSTNIYRITESTYKPLRVCTCKLVVVVNPVGSVVLLISSFLCAMLFGLDKTHLTKFWKKPKEVAHEQQKR